MSIKDKCIELDSTYTISLASLTDFEWDTLYVISGPTVDNEAGDIIGIDYKKIIPDNNRQYIFIKKGRVVKEYPSHCKNLGSLSGFGTGKNYLKYNNSTIISVKKHHVENGIYYSVVDVKD